MSKDDQAAPALGRPEPKIYQGDARFDATAAAFLEMWALVSPKMSKALAELIADCVDQPPALGLEALAEKLPRYSVTQNWRGPLHMVTDPENPERGEWVKWSDLRAALAQMRGAR